MTSTTRILIACLVAVAVLAPVPAGATEAAHCEEVHVESFEIKLRAERAVYEVGETARVRAVVTSMATGEPASDIDVGLLGSSDDDHWVFDQARTNERGRAWLEIPLKKMRPGWMTLHAYAWRRTVDTTCVAVTEYGSKLKRRAFRVVPD